MTIDARGRTALAGYAVVYAGLLAAMRVRHGFALAEPLFVLAVFGIAFSLLALALTRGLRPGRPVVRAPRREIGWLSAWLLVIAGYFVWGAGVLQALLPDERARATATLVLKLLFFVAVPFAIVRACGGYGPADLVAPDRSPARRARAVLGLSLAAIVFQAAFGQGPRLLREANPSAAALALGTPVAFVWLAVEAGLVEEFFFRTLYQTRAAALFRSDLAGLVLASAAFGLTHAPGLFLRADLMQEATGTQPTALLAIGYSVVVTSVAGLFLGVLWWRTRDLWALVLVHAAADLLPNLAPFLRTWGFASAAQGALAQTLLIVIRHSALPGAGTWTR